ncbi:hypothetical protein SteCoe_18765 [Stentor coeruleus]|uniref:TPR-like protein n=1 Tax=Stentor coeruleus TaxID=5963 RepID=A0A1R2BWE3_9CILI|nr:hypothetical protein SteCoe_18765 [Stentor coeruleus]
MRPIHSNFLSFTSKCTSPKFNEKISIRNKNFSILDSSTSRNPTSPRHKKPKSLKNLSLKPRVNSNSPEATRLQDRRPNLSLRGKSSFFKPNPKLNISRKLKISSFRNFNTILSPSNTQIPENLSTLESTKRSTGAKTSIIAAKNEISRKKYDIALGILENIDEESAESLYLQGLCNLHLKNYEKALKTLQSPSIIQTPSTLMVICKCFCALQNYLKALETLNSCINLNGQYIQAYFLRGKVLIALKKYDEALSDLIRLQHPQAYLLISSCWKHKNNYKNTVKYLEKYKNTANFIEKYFLELAKVDYFFDRIPEALQSLEQLGKIDKNNLEGVYYKGKCLIKYSNYDEAELLFEKVAQNADNDELANRALFKIMLIKQEMYDFFGSYFVLKRVIIKQEMYDFFGSYFVLKRVKGQVRSKKKVFYQKLAEGIYYVIQSKFIIAIELLSSIADDDLDSKGLFKCLIFRAFSYFSIKGFEQAINDYKKAQTLGVLDPASQFNYKISLSVIDIANKNLDSAYKILTSGFFKKFSNPMWPILKLHVEILMKSADINEIKKLYVEFKSVKLEKNCEFYLIRSFFEYLDLNIDSSLKKINKSIKISDKSSFLAYTIRAFCYISFKKYGDAIEDLTTALALNKELKTLRAYRALCYFYNGDLENAVKDILKIFKIEDYSAILMSIYMLIVCQQYDKVLEVLECVKMTDEILLMKAHCYLLLEYYEDSIETLYQREKHDIEKDVFMIQSFKDKSFKTIGPGVLISQLYALWFEGTENFYNKHFDTSIHLYKLVLENLNSNHEDLVFADNYISESLRLEILYNLTLSYIFTDTILGFSRAAECLNSIIELKSNKIPAELYVLLGVAEKGMKKMKRYKKTLEKLKGLDSKMHDFYVRNQSIRLNPKFSEDKFTERFPFVPIFNMENLMVRPITRLPLLTPPLDYTDSFDALISIVKMEGPIVRPEVPWIAKKNDKYMFTDTMLEDISSFNSESAATIKVDG